MQDILQSLGSGILSVLTPSALLWILLGGLIGTVVGAIPGLGPSCGIALLLPISYSLPHVEGLSLIIAIYLGAMYGGRISSILINTPGDNAAVMTCMDGYPLMKQGKGGKALGISCYSSFIGGMIGIICMTFITPWLAKAALAFGSAETCIVMLFGLVAISMATDSKSVRGLLMVAVGLLIATMGSEYVSGKLRLTFGIPELFDGINFVPAALGLFGFTEVLCGMEARSAASMGKIEVSLRSTLPNGKELKRVTPATLLGTLLGLFVGILPGAGATLATFVSYGAAKKVSRHPEEFGKGSLEGVAAPEAANNACVAGALTPMLAIGIPGSSVAALIMGAFIMQDLQPGPLMFQRTPDIAWAIIAGLYVCNVILLLMNIGLIPVFTGLVRISEKVLYPCVAFLCVVGSFCLQNSMFDVIVMLIFGFLGYFMRKGGYPVAGLLLALILGNDIEQNFRQAMIMSHGSLGIFVASPLCKVFFALTIVCILFPVLKWAFEKWIRKPKLETAAEPSESE